MTSDMDVFVKSAGLLAVLLNPFLMSIYLLDLIQTLDAQLFRRVVVRAALISGSVFALVSFTGEALFTDVLQVHFSSFLVFGGIVFLIVAVRFVLSGSEALESMRGAPEYCAGSVAMPFMIGPATVSASVIIGQRLSFPASVAAIAAALAFAVVGLVAFKAAHDWVKTEDAARLARYVDVTGRVMALLMGTFAVEMILKGLELWREGRFAG